MPASGPTQQHAAINAAVLEQLANPAMQKQAEDSINSYTRLEMREEGCYRKIIPMVDLPDSELDAVLGSALPMKLCWKQPMSPGALSIPFMGSPRSFFIRGPNYPVFFHEIAGPRHMTNINELRVYPYDIRQLLMDESVRDIMEEEDKRFLVDGVNAGLIGQEQVSPFTGAKQWRRFRGGWTRHNVIETFKIIPEGSTNGSTDTVLINNSTVREFQKWGRDEMGGDMSQELIKNGKKVGQWLEGEFLQVRWLVTIKRNLVPNGSMYMFSTPDYMGKSFALQDVTMHIKREANQLAYHPYETIGGALGNLAGIARADVTA